MLGITRPIHAFIDNALKLDTKHKKPLYSSKNICRELSKNKLPDFDGFTLITNLYQAIENVKRGERTPSRKNWRWRTRTNQATTNSRAETSLERDLIRWEHKDWANQIPTSSGLVDARLDKARNIDLVHRCANGWYEFIELKVKSDTPLFAAMEILQYGLLYIFSRTNRKDWEYPQNDYPLLYSKGVHLKVLAPDEYYTNDTTGTRYELGWIEKNLDDGLKAFLAQKNCDYDMAFSFESITNVKQWPKDPIRNQARVYATNS